MKELLSDYVDSMEPHKKALIKHLFSNQHDNSCDECNRASDIAINDEELNTILKKIVENIRREGWPIKITTEGDKLWEKTKKRLNIIVEDE
jgi:gamma-glutamyl phosphate reductase